MAGNQAAAAELGRESPQPKNLLDQRRNGKSIKADVVVGRVNHHPDAFPLKAQSAIVVVHRAGGKLIEFRNARRHKRVVRTVAASPDQRNRGDEMLLMEPDVAREGLVS